MKDLLKEYNQKRDFSQTSEPVGKISASKQMRFVIQKHDATRLHYDFRIEYDGVLKSWAVPKGLPYKSSERHLAMQVEDHPLSYFDFEGIIPEGNYGAGEVIVWDLGNYWVPHATNEKEANEKIKTGFKKGEIKLILNGKKVKGLFALVRFKKAGDNAWLMIKDKDEYEGVDFSKNEKSVKTGKTLNQLALKPIHESAPSFAKATEAKQLEFIKPMLASMGEKIPESEDYLFEEKFDGYRMIAVIDHGKVNLFSRNGVNWNIKFPQVAKDLTSIKTDCVLDGELVAYDQKGNTTFQMLQNHLDADHLKYHIFDILNLNNISTLQLPLLERKKYLAKVVKSHKHIVLTNYQIGSGKEFFKTMKTKEGMIAKKLTSKYIPGDRSHEWLKFKNRLRDEFVIAGVTKPTGSRFGFGALEIGYYQKDKLIYAGRVGTGFDDKLIKKLFTNLQKIKRKDSPFSDYDGDKSVQFWVEPILICEVTFAGWTTENLILQASFVGLRIDKLAHQVKGDYSLLEKIITKPDKVFWPEKNYTKLDLAKYYFEVSPILLPYLKDRPQNLNRHPDGIHGISFYHKDIEINLPDYVQTTNIKREEVRRDKDGTDQQISYLVCQNVETLIYMANLGCIEINPWLSKITDLTKPDYLVFDVDPGDVDFGDVIKIARALYNLLEQIDIKPFIKTSGKRGIHIYAYLAAKYSFIDARNFAELVSKIILNKYPQIVSLERSPAKRKHKIYIDYLQNRQGQTTASIYSVRPNQFAGVSMPITVSELTATLDPSNYHMKNALKRIDKVGDLWKDIKKYPVDLSKALQKLKEDL